MLSENEQIRYQRQLMLPEIGLSGQLKLKSAKVLIVGAGGLGCPVLQYLAAAGVGTIGIADHDVVEDSNLQRQVLYTTDDIGKPKAMVAAEKARSLNPFIKLLPLNIFINAANVFDVIADYDLVVDGSDNFSTRYLLNDACVIANKPLVFGAIFKFAGQLSVFNYQDGPTYRCIFSEPPAEDEAPNCAAIGVIASLPGIIGTLQATEVIKIITGTGEVLSGKLMVMDLLSMQIRTLSFSANPANKLITQPGQYTGNCCVKGTVIKYERLEELMRDANIQLVDVREPAEHRRHNIGGINIPLGMLVDNCQEFDPLTPVVLYCATGIRSKAAMEMLLNKGFREVYSLQHGLAGIPLSSR